MMRYSPGRALGKSLTIIVELKGAGRLFCEKLTEAPGIALTAWPTTTKKRRTTGFPGREPPTLTVNVAVPGGLLTVLEVGLTERVHASWGVVTTTVTALLFGGSGPLGSAYTVSE